MRTSHLPALLPLFATVSACVVPVGPEWTDPQRNYPATLRAAIPPVGSILTPAPDAGGPLTVTVWLGDQNTHDILRARWIIDYPPFVDGVSHLAWQDIQPGGNQVDRPPLTFAPNCSDDHIAVGFKNHRLLFVASDGPFASDDPSQATPDLVQDGNSRVEATWQFELDCP